MKKLILLATIFASFSQAYAASETWSCISTDKKTEIVAVVDDNSATATIDGVLLDADEISKNLTILSRDIGTRDIYHYELKLIRSEQSKAGEGSAIYYYDESIDCLGEYHSVTELTCTVQ
ncbi:MAG: hypothetical protein Q7U04_07875 [Bacteriovorax sp.]|nr:hypothetical protein [Bacteriovorax sp.]